jgi:hypothetical protein
MNPQNKANTNPLKPNLKGGKLENLQENCKNLRKITEVGNARAFEWYYFCPAFTVAYKWRTCPKNLHKSPIAL